MKSQIPSNLKSFLHATFSDMLPSLEGWPTAGVGSLLRHAVTFLVSAFCILHSAFPVCAALEVQNGAVSNVTATNAALSVSLVSTNSTNAAVTVFYGTAAGGTNTAFWQYSNYFGVVSTGIYSFVTTNLTPRVYYYFCAYASETTNTDWTGMSNFTTLARTVTNWPALTNDITQMVDTDGNWKTPSKAKIIAANGLASTSDLSGYNAQIIVVSARVDVAESNIATNASEISNVKSDITTVSNQAAAHITNNINPHGVTAAQAGAASTAALAGVQSNVGIVSNQAAAHITNNINPHGVTAAQAGAASTAELAGVQSNVGIVSNQAAAHITNNLNPHAVTTDQIGAVPTNDALYGTIGLSMTNYVHVPSSTNWLNYDPATRLFSGCATNIGSGGTVAGDSVVFTNLRVISDGCVPVPDVRGDYVWGGEYNGANYFSSTNGQTIYFNSGIEWDIGSSLGGGMSFYTEAAQRPAGAYLGGTDGTQLVTAAFYYTTNVQWAVDKIKVNESDVQRSTNAISARMSAAESATQNLATTKANLSGVIFTGPISNAAGYFGNAGGLTNIPGTLNTAEKLLATNSVQTGGAASVASLQVTGGSPTNNARFVSTNSSGQGVWMRNSTKTWSLTTQSTNTANITVSGIGFRPSGAIIFATANGAVAGTIFSQGSIDSTGGAQCVTHFFSVGGISSPEPNTVPAKCYMYGASYAWSLNWASWTDDGATFTTTCPAWTNNIYLNGLFFP